MKATVNNIQEVRNAVNAKNQRSAWNKGVQTYANMLLDNFEEWSKYNQSEGKELPIIDEKTALNGASDWSAWSYGACGLVYDFAIAETLCTKSEIKKLQYKTGGMRYPAPCTNWCDVEARAARQAWQMILEAVRGLEA